MCQYASYAVGRRHANTHIEHVLTSLAPILENLVQPISRDGSFPLGLVPVIGRGTSANNANAFAIVDRVVEKHCIIATVEMLSRILFIDSGRSNLCQRLVKGDDAAAVPEACKDWIDRWVSMSC